MCKPISGMTLILTVAFTDRGTENGAQVAAVA
jgi:hypothetical protein